MYTSGEFAVLGRFIGTAIKSGLVVSVFDGEEWAVKKSHNPKEILDAATSVEEAQLVLRQAEDGKKVGWALVIWGNASDGSELVADYSDNEFMRRLVTVAEA